MSQFQCPLCGKYNSYRRYDPLGFDDDIYGADVVGLGRGRGFSFSEKYSLLNDDHLCGLIVQRCRKILGFTEGVEPPPPGAVAELKRINGEWVAWGADMEKTLTQSDAKLASLQNKYNSLLHSYNSLHEESSAQNAQTEDLDRIISKWKIAHNNVKVGSDAKDRTIRDLKADNQRLRNDIEAYQGADEDSVAAAEMEELLEKINDSSNTDYDNLSDAIDWLLEE